MGSWQPDAPGVLVLPSGRAIRGRSLRAGEPGACEDVLPEFGLYLSAGALPAMRWPRRRVHWRDWWLPTEPADAVDAYDEAWHRSVVERVEVACAGGRGRTGTALACIAVLDGVPPDAAVRYVRAHYDRRAVETPWQRRYVASAGSPGSPEPC